MGGAFLWSAGDTGYCLGVESSSRGLVSLYCLVACLSAAAASSVAAGAKNDGVLGQEERERKDVVSCE